LLAKWESKLISFKEKTIDTPEEASEEQYDPEKWLQERLTILRLAECGVFSPRMAKQYSFGESNTLLSQEDGKIRFF
jgi:hypothetical protein